MNSVRPRAVGRRQALRLLSATTMLSTLGMTGLPLRAQSDAPAFSFDMLSEQMRQRSKAPQPAPEEVEGFLAGLDYDGYQRIRFRPEMARWRDVGGLFQVHAFHMGWLYKEPVRIYEVVDGAAREMTFTTADFEYHGPLKDQVPADTPMPGVAGFRLNTPLNSADRFDEVVAFLGASYFRALGRGNFYGLSARGLAVNTGLSGAEEFPRFSAFYLERPAPGATSVVLYAALDSKSVTGAFRFVVTPGQDTVMDVTARLYFRADIEQLGVAPLTSMYLFGENDPGEFDDYRPQVHDSEALILRSHTGEVFYRPLNNPPKLASSYLGSQSPRGFGLMQRDREFDNYLDAQAHYEKRPSLMVEPRGDWGRGSVRLVEIPSDLEGNDNIVAFWVPEAPVRAGETMEVSYRLHWGDLPPDAGEDIAHVLRTRTGEGGISGVSDKADRRKFVVDFAGGLLGELSADAKVSPSITVSRGEVAEAVLSKIAGTKVWRLVAEISAPAGSIVEIRAGVSGYGRNLTESWLYQWIKE
ncbi:glucan biosynthesis protein D [Pseudooceanicola sp. 216_PA32_1]|uniref:Glucan biosynthesis protein D n=1 Tax=Pseudooceanicola pacificus TaxID=2676438 RepID=A0A844WBE5_9RHOB|nr:glucan biosynthesis protein [Pseudooceanicola pacificus]MWB76590.1 glucan biosynthesis protein D [Pseudooceanicola pacificus]